jgi:hypothetical protein
MKQVKTIFQLDNEGSAHQFQVVTGADTGKDYLFVKSGAGGFKHEFVGSENDYYVVMKDLIKARTVVFVYPVWEEAVKPVKNVTKPSKE